MHPSYLRSLATPDRKKYLRNIPLATLLRFLLLHTRGWTRPPAHSLGSEPYIAFAYRSSAWRKSCTISSTVSVIGLARWVFCMVGSACRLPPAIRPRRIPLLGSYLHAMLSCHRRERLEAKVDGLAVLSGRRQPA